MSTGVIANEAQIDKAAMLQRVALFEGLDQARRQELATLCRVGVFPAGDEIIEQGDELAEEEDGLYIILDGTVEVRRDSRDGTDGRLVATLGPNEFFGEMALLDGHARSASVFAVSEVLCIMLSRWDFQRQLRTHPEIAMRVLAVLSERIRGLLETH